MQDYQFNFNIKEPFYSVLHMYFKCYQSIVTRIQVNLIFRNNTPSHSLTLSQTIQAFYTKPPQSLTYTQSIKYYTEHILVFKICACFMKYLFQYFYRHFLLYHISCGNNSAPHPFPNLMPDSGEQSTDANELVFSFLSKQAFGLLYGSGFTGVTAKVCFVLGLNCLSYGSLFQPVR